MVAVPDKWSFYSSCKSVRSAVLGAAKYAVLLPRPIRGGDLDIAAAADAVRNVLSLATHVTQVSPSPARHRATSDRPDRPV